MSAAGFTVYPGGPRLEVTFAQAAAVFEVTVVTLGGGTVAVDVEVAFQDGEVFLFQDGETFIY